MKTFGSKELEQRDLGDSLVFVLTRNHGWFEIAVEAVVIGGFCFYAWWRGSAIAIIFAALAVIGILANWAHGRKTTLRVSENGIIARGNLDSWFTTETNLRVEEITSMEWRSASEGDNGGLSVSQGFAQAWVLPGITEEQGRGIIDAIADKFPDFPVADRGPASMLYGNDAGITTLGLSQREGRSGNPKA